MAINRMSRMQRPVQAPATPGQPAPTPMSKPPKTDSAYAALRQSRMGVQPQAKPARNDQGFAAMRQARMQLPQFTGFHPQVSPGMMNPMERVFQQPPPTQQFGAGQPTGPMMNPIEDIFRQAMGQWLLRKQQAQQGGGYMNPMEQLQPTAGTLPPFPNQNLPAFPGGGAIPYATSFGSGTPPPGQMSLWI